MEFTLTQLSPESLSRLVRMVADTKARGPWFGEIVGFFTCKKIGFSLKKTSGMCKGCRETVTQFSAGNP